MIGVTTQEEDVWSLDIYDSTTPYELCNDLPESLKSQNGLQLHFI